MINARTVAGVYIYIYIYTGNFIKIIKRKKIKEDRNIMSVLMKHTG